MKREKRGVKLLSPINVLKVLLEQRSINSSLGHPVVYIKMGKLSVWTVIHNSDNIWNIPEMSWACTNSFYFQAKIPNTRPNNICPEILKALDGILFIAEHKKKDEKATKVNIQFFVWNMEIEFCV